MLVGFFGTYLYDGTGWIPHQPDELPTIAKPWLVVDIHDSDITTVTYRPAGPGSGVAYLGHTPRTYFEDADASAPTDVAREATGLGSWWAELRGGASDSERRAKEAELAAYLAEHADSTDIDLDADADADEDAAISVEVKTARFLATLDLPVPDELAG